MTKKRIFNSLIVLGLIVSGALVVWAKGHFEEESKCSVCPCSVPGCCPPDETEPDNDPV